MPAHAAPRDDFDEIVEMFFDEIEPVITRLPDVDAAPTLAGDLHFLKSGALNLGFERFAALCSAGEAAAEQGQTKAINIPQLLEVYATSKNQFLSGLAQLNAA
jgi:HPt (histidine-containing phosphotransfer) domain-containing protein